MSNFEFENVIDEKFIQDEFEEDGECVDYPICC